MPKLFVTSLAAVLAGMIASVSLAQQYPVGSDEGVPGEELWVACGFCHGPEGQGGPALDAPPLAAMEAWYVENQLRAFKNGWRGMHPDDVSGLQMSIVSGIARNEPTIKNVAAYIETLDPNPEPEMINGQLASSDRAFLWVSEYADLEHPEPANVQNGKAIYSTSCVACHGATGEGNQALSAPKLTALPEWYIHRQLQYFRSGIRGNHREDIWGASMVPFVLMLSGNQAVADVTAYIETL